MNSRKTVLAALNHQETGKVPVDLGGTESSGMTALAYRNLCSHMGIDIIPKVFEPFQYVSYINKELRDLFNVDTLNLTPEPKSWKKVGNPRGFDVMLPEQWNEENSEEGTVVKQGDSVIARRPVDSHYFDPVNPPLIHVTSSNEIVKYASQIKTFDWPFFVDEGMESLESRAREMVKEEKCVVFNFCCHILAAGQLLRGYENFMMDLLCEEKMVHSIFENLLEGYFERISKLAPLLKNHVDVVLLNDDLGTQQGPMLAPELYRSMIKPYQKQLIDKVKDEFQCPVLFHSCGAIREFIPDLIEVGVDAINPVQLTASGMALKELKSDFGNDICFWGGGVDTQHVLNSSGPDEVKDAVKKSVDILAPGGGFVFCQVHNIQPDVPTENVMAMFEMVNQISKGL